MATILLLSTLVLQCAAYSYGSCNNMESSVVNNMSISELTNNGWTVCLDENYWYSTTFDVLASCYKGPDYWVFIGAKLESSDKIRVGAYGPASVLITKTSSTTTAYKPINDDSYNVYWYNRQEYPAFGFAPIQTVQLSNVDVYDPTDNQRLSWWYAADGWRAGSLNRHNGHGTDWYDIYRKLIYYKDCAGTANPTSDPTSTTSTPTSAPTSSPIFNGSNCEDLGYIKHINWDNMVNNGKEEIPDINYTISASPQNMTLTIDVELDYLGYSYINNIYGYGTRYHLGFYSFDSDSNISNCDNRLASSFVNTSWSEQWKYSEYPYSNNQIGSENYLAYPPSNYWTLSMNEAHSCSKIIYSAVFTWQDLRECKSDDGKSNAITVDIDDQFINMSGRFYVEVVSPVSMNADILYRTYELVSHPFVISIQKSIYSINNVNNIFTFTSSIMNVGRINENVLEIVLLTESMDHISLSDPILLSSPDYDESRFTITNNVSTCLSIHSDLCAQLWQIMVNVECPFTFDDDFAFQFTANCENQNINDNRKCANYTATYGSVVSLTAGLAFSDYICSDDVLSIRYNSEMVIYDDNTFTSPTGANAIALIGDRVYVQVSIDNVNVDNNGYAVLDAKLLNVWLCTSGNELSLNQNDLGNSGCFTANLDADGPYHIIVNSEAVIEGARHENDTSNGMVRFSFIIPSTITRDTLFIQAQISMDFTQDNPRRRLLASGAGATQIVYESGTIQIMDKPTSTEIIDEKTATKGTNKEDSDDEEEEKSEGSCMNLFFIVIFVSFTMVIFK